MTTVHLAHYLIVCLKSRIPAASIPSLGLVLTDWTLFLELGRLEVAAAKAERGGDREGFRDQEGLRPGEREWGQEEIVSTMSDQTESKM